MDRSPRFSGTPDRRRTAVCAALVALLIAADLLSHLVGPGFDLVPFLIVLVMVAGLLLGPAAAWSAGTAASLYALVRILFVPGLAHHLVLAASALAAGAAAALLYRRRFGSTRTVRSPEERKGLQLLSDTCDILGASLKVEVSSSRFLHRLMPEWADWCSLDITTPRGEIKRLAAAHRDEGMREVLDELEAYPPELLSDAPIARVLRSGNPVVIEELDPSLLDRIARDEHHRELLRSLRPRSALVLPLVARNRMVGALTMVMSDSGRRYREDDLPIALQLADRVAMAIDNAQLFHEAVDANQAKADFLAVMSHELRTPLSAILGYSDLLEAGIAGPTTPEQRAQIARIRASAWHLADLVDEVLTFARVEAGRREIHVEEVGVVSLARSVAESTRTAIAGRPIELKVAPQEGEVRLQTDRTKLRQILVNLLSNAVKFTTQGTIEVQIEERTEAGRVAITVTDTGHGISAGHIDRIFEPFWQADQGPTRVVSGTGLGLAVAQRLATILGGEIKVESTLGTGSTFRVDLPQRSGRIAEERISA